MIPPFKRKDASYAFAFDDLVMRLLIGSSEEEVARRLGISAETVGRIVKNQLQDDAKIDPARWRCGRNTWGSSARMPPPEKHNFKTCAQG